MPEDEPLAAERRFGLGPAQAGAERRGQRAAVDVDAAQAGEVEADQPRVGAAQRLDPADDAGAAAVGDDGDALRGAGLEDRRQPPGVVDEDDGVGGRLQPARAQPGEVGVAAAGRVADAVLGADEDVLGAGRVEQRLRQRLRGGQLDVLGARGRARRRRQLTDPLAQGRQRVAVELRRVAGVPPPPPLRVAPRRFAPSAPRVGSGAPARSRRGPRRGSRPGRGASAASRGATIPRSVCSEVSRTSVPAALLAQLDLHPARRAGGVRRAFPRSAAPRCSARPRPSSGSGSRRARRAPRRSPAPWSIRCGGRRPWRRRSRPGWCAATSAAGCRGRRPAPRPRRAGPRPCGGGRRGPSAAG